MTAAGPMKTITPDSVTGLAGRVSTEELEALRRTTMLKTGAVYSSEIMVTTSQTTSRKENSLRIT
jgi:hypothetical protein